MLLVNSNVKTLSIRILSSGKAGYLKVNRNYSWHVFYCEKCMIEWKICLWWQIYRHKKWSVMRKIAKPTCGFCKALQSGIKRQRKRTLQWNSWKTKTFNCSLTFCISEDSIPYVIIKKYNKLAQLTSELFNISTSHLYYKFILSHSN